MNKSKLFVAVYGTLKKGEPNHKYFLENSKQIKNTKIKGELFQFKARSYPVLIESNSKEVECEVYQITEENLFSMHSMEKAVGYKLGLTKIKVENNNYPLFYFYMSKTDKEELEKTWNETFIPINNYSYKNLNKIINSFEHEQYGTP